MSSTIISREWDDVAGAYESKPSIALGTSSEASNCSNHNVAVAFSTTFRYMFREGGEKTSILRRSVKWSCFHAAPTMVTTIGLQFLVVIRRPIL